MILQDGKGSGSKAAVNSANQLLTRTVIISELAAATELGNAYSWTAVSADINTGDTGLSVANTSTDMLLYIDKVYVWADVPTQFKIHVPAAATWTGTAVVGINLNQGSNKIAPATAFADETASTFAAANVITTVASNEFTDDQFGQWIEYDGALILGQNDAIQVDLIGESAAFECTIIGHFKDKE